MERMLFVNLPVAQLPRATGFYAALGFTGNPQFTDEQAACMVWSETIFVMLHVERSWRRFTDRPFPAKGASEVMLAINLADRLAVDAMLDTAAAKGGTADVNPVQDLGFMYSRAFTDPDGHIWEAFWMDPASASGHDAGNDKAGHGS